MESTVSVNRHDVKFVARSAHRIELACTHCLYAILASIGELANRDDVDAEIFKIDALEPIRSRPKPHARVTQLVNVRLLIRRERPGHTLPDDVLPRLSKILGVTVRFEG